jgi:hypothetical protein
MLGSAVDQAVEPVKLDVSSDGLALRLFPRERRCSRGRSHVTSCGVLHHWRMSDLRFGPNPAIRVVLRA